MWKCDILISSVDRLSDLLFIDRCLISSRSIVQILHRLVCVFVEHSSIDRNSEEILRCSDDAIECLQADADGILPVESLLLLHLPYPLLDLHSIDDEILRSISIEVLAQVNGPVLLSFTQKESEWLSRRRDISRSTRLLIDWERLFSSFHQVPTRCCAERSFLSTVWYLSKSVSWQRSMANSWPISNTRENKLPSIAEQQWWCFV